MRKIFSGLFLVVGLVLSLTSCSTDTYYNFDEDDEKWLLYTQGRILKFQDSTGTIETFYVRNKSRGYKTEDDIYYQHCSIDVVKSEDSVSTGAVGGIYVIRKEEGPSVTISWPHHPLHMNPLAQVPSSVTVKGKFYNDVYVSVADTVFLTPLGYNIIKFYYSKSNGFIRFDKYNGNKFELIN